VHNLQIVIPPQAGTTASAGTAMMGRHIGQVALPNGRNLAEPWVPAFVGRPR